MELSKVLPLPASCIGSSLHKRHFAQDDTVNGQDASHTSRHRAAIYPVLEYLRR